jgi:hypothetical protein
MKKITKLKLQLFVPDLLLGEQIGAYKQQP